MKRTLLFTLLIFSILLTSCALKSPTQSIELIIIEVDRSTNTAQLELRNYSANDVEYAVKNFISSPNKTQKIPDVTGIEFGAHRALLKSNETVELSWKHVYNDFPIGVFIYHKNNANPEIIWTKNTAFAIE